MSRYREFLAACPRLMIFFLCCRVLLTAQTPVPPDDAPITDRERALLDRITRLLQYHLSPKLTFAGRFEYLQDHGGLFSGLTQDLKEHTLTATYQFADGFQTRMEYRRDFSNQPFFLTGKPGFLKKEQNTATLGLIWWFGGKSESW